MRIAFIGGGNMATALIGGMSQQVSSADSIYVVEINPESRATLAKQFGVTTLSAIDQTCQAVDVIVLAVKPQQLRGVAKTLAPYLQQQLVISIAAGIRSSDLSSWLNAYQNIIRVMPNTPALIKSGIAGLYAMPNVTDSHKALATQILNGVGSTVWVDQEDKMDAITAISGSGPAYVFYFIEALEEAAIQLGLTPQQAKQLSLETFLGAAKLAHSSDEPIGILRSRVTSPGGTTERAIKQMEACQLKQYIIDAAKAAALRSKELGDEIGK